MKGMLFLAVRTNGGVSRQLPRRGRSRNIQNVAIMRTTTTDAPITGSGTLERYGIVDSGEVVILVIV